MKKLLILLTVLIFSNTNLFSQPLFVENFNFPPMDTLHNIGGWLRTGPNTPKTVKVISQGLSYTGYAGSGIGNCAFLTNESLGGVSLNSFETQSSGTVYMSFLIRVDSMSVNATQGFNICLDQEGGTTNLNTKVYIQKVTSGSFKIGISKTSNVPSYASPTFLTNTTYLVIATYTNVAGSNNDYCKIYISSSGVPATEPVSHAAIDSTGFDVNDLGDIQLLNSFIQTGLQGSSVKIDGIRVGNTWTSTLFQNINMQLNLKALIQGFYNGTTSRMVKDTAKVLIRYSKSPYTIADSSKAVLDSIGKGTFTFNRVGNNVAYYFVVKHRNTIETWRALPLSFNSFDNTANVDLTLFQNSAYGENLEQIAGRYCMYNGDVNQDGVVDVGDLVPVYNSSVNFASGYIPTDATGDNFVDVSDIVVTFNNSTNFVSVIRP